MNVKASEVIDVVLDRLDAPEKWWRGQGGGLATEKECVLTAAGGAVVSVMGVDEWLQAYDTGDERKPISRVMHFIHAELDGRDIAGWNDDPRTSFEDMRLTLKLAKERALEAGE